VSNSFLKKLSTMRPVCVLGTPEDIFSKVGFAVRFLSDVEVLLWEDALMKTNADGLVIDDQIVIAINVVTGAILYKLEDL